MNLGLMFMKYVAWMKMNSMNENHNINQVDYMVRKISHGWNWWKFQTWMKMIVVDRYTDICLLYT
jgi:hypothetical protein